ncbi:MAG: hypothetical protein AAF533_02740 [Acidobacteriota bacterium]
MSLELAPTPAGVIPALAFLLSSEVGAWTVGERKLARRVRWLHLIGLAVVLLTVVVIAAVRGHLDFELGSLVRVLTGPWPLSQVLIGLTPVVTTAALVARRPMRLLDGLAVGLPAWCAAWVGLRLLTGSVGLSPALAVLAGCGLTLACCLLVAPDPSAVGTEDAGGRWAGGKVSGLALHGTGASLLIGAVLLPAPPPWPRLALAVLATLAGGALLLVTALRRTRVTVGESTD